MPPKRSAKKGVSLTMKSIAKKAGVSTMTVSRALRGDPRHSIATRERIRRIAEGMGYRKNPLVAALMSTRARNTRKPTTANLAAVSFSEGKAPPRPKDYEAKGRGSDEFIHGIVDHARNLGYAIEEYRFEQLKMTAARLREILLNRGVRGIILLPAPFAPLDFDFDFDGFATSAIGYSVSNPRLARVTSDAYPRVLTALQHLAEKGYRRIGLVASPDQDRRFLHGMSAAVKVAREVDPRLKVRQYLLDTVWEVQPLGPTMRSKLTAWIRHNKLEVVMSQMNSLYGTLTDEGFRMPEDISYLHLHSHSDPRIAHMDQMCRLVGQKAVDVVVGMINRNEFFLPKYPTVLLIPSVWKDGDTVPDLATGNS